MRINVPQIKSLLAAFIILFYSCSNSITTTKKLNYNTYLNQQFWTADWSADDKQIAVGGVDSILRLYNSKNLGLTKSYTINSWIHSIKQHPSKNLLAVATHDRYVLLINLDTDSIIPLKGKEGSRAIGWNYNGDFLAVGDYNGDIHIWDSKGNLISSKSKNYSADVAGESYLSLDWHPTKNTFIATNFEITHFDSAGNELKVMTHPNKEAIMLCVAWHPSGNFFVIGDYGHSGDKNNIPSLLHFWSKDGHYIKSVTGSKAEYRNIVWNKKGTLLATASDVLRTWTSTGTLMSEGLKDSTNYLWGIDWNTAGDKIVTASRFKTISLWDSTARLLKRVDVEN